MKRPSSRIVGIVLAALAAITLAGAAGGIVSHRIAGDDDRRFDGREGPWGGGDRGWRGNRGGPGGMHGSRGDGDRGGFGGPGGDGPPGGMGGPGGGNSWPGGDRGGDGPAGGMRGPGVGPGMHGGAPPFLLTRAMRDHLGVTEAELKAALLKSIDDLEASDEIDEDMADRMRDQIEDSETLLGSPDDDDEVDVDKA